MKLPTFNKQRSTNNQLSTQQRRPDIVDQLIVDRLLRVEHCALNIALQEVLRG